MPLFMAFKLLKEKGFDICKTHHVQSLLEVDFRTESKELQEVLQGLSIPIAELVAGGGGEAKLTKRLRNQFEQMGWRKHTFKITQNVDGETVSSTSHIVDHVKISEKGTIAMEIEWNNKDPFFDRDMENFKRLHGVGAISLGVIITRGRSFQSGIESLLADYAQRKGWSSIGDLRNEGLRPTERQSRIKSSNAKDFPAEWAKQFSNDKFSASTTHWGKFLARIDRGVGNPCPIVAFGIPLNVVLSDC